MNSCHHCASRINYNDFTVECTCNRVVGFYISPDDIPDPVAAQSDSFLVPKYDHVNNRFLRKQESVIGWSQEQEILAAEEIQQPEERQIVEEILEEEGILQPEERQIVEEILAVVEEILEEEGVQLAQERQIAENILAEEGFLQPEERPIVEEILAAEGIQQAEEEILDLAVIKAHGEDPQAEVVEWAGQQRESKILHVRNFGHMDFTEEELKKAFEARADGSVDRIKKCANFALVYFFEDSLALEALEEGLLFQGAELHLSYATIPTRRNANPEM